MEYTTKSGQSFRDDFRNIADSEHILEYLVDDLVDDRPKGCVADRRRQRNLVTSNERASWCEYDSGLRQSPER